MGVSITQAEKERAKKSTATITGVQGAQSYRRKEQKLKIRKDNKVSLLGGLPLR